MHSIKCGSKATTEHSRKCLEFPVSSFSTSGVNQLTSQRLNFFICRFTLQSRRNAVRRKCGTTLNGDVQIQKHYTAVLTISKEHTPSSRLPCYRRGRWAIPFSSVAAVWLLDLPSDRPTFPSELSLWSSGIHSSQGFHLTPYRLCSCGVPVALRSVTPRKAGLQVTFPQHSPLSKALCPHQEFELPACKLFLISSSLQVLSYFWIYSERKPSTASKKVKSFTSNWKNLYAKKQRLHGDPWSAGSYKSTKRESQWLSH